MDNEAVPAARIEVLWRPGCPFCSRLRPVGAVWTIGLAVIWGLLSVWQPTTTWHLAPVLLAGSWP